VTSLTPLGAINPSYAWGAFTALMDFVEYALRASLKLPATDPFATAKNIKAKLSFLINLNVILFNSIAVQQPSLRQCTYLK
jgi:hypothetical protein